MFSIEICYNGLVICFRLVQNDSMCRILRTPFWYTPIITFLWISICKARELITLIFPRYIRSRYIEEFNNDLTFSNFCSKFILVLSLAKKSKLITRDLKLPVHDLVDRYEISISQMTMDIFRLSWIKIHSYTYCDHHRLWLNCDCDYWVTRRVPLVEQELLTLPEHLNSHWLL